MVGNAQKVGITEKFRPILVTRKKFIGNWGTLPKICPNGRRGAGAPRGQPQTTNPIYHVHTRNRNLG